MKKGRPGESMYDAGATDAAVLLIEGAFLEELQAGLKRLGFSTVPEDSFGVLALRVVDDCHVGTAYVEFRDGAIRMRIVIQQDRDAAA